MTSDLDRSKHYLTSSLRSDVADVAARLSTVLYFKHIQQSSIHRGTKIMLQNQHKKKMNIEGIFIYMPHYYEEIQTGAE